MKEKIHPKYVDAKFICACGAELTTKSTVVDISVEVCSNCHPFYTGKQKSFSSAGRAEKFKNKYSKKKAETSAAASPAS